MRCTSCASPWALAFVTDLLAEQSKQSFTHGRRERVSAIYRIVIVCVYVYVMCVCVCVCIRVNVCVCVCRYCRRKAHTSAINRGSARNHLERYHSLAIEWRNLGRISKDLFGILAPNCVDCVRCYYSHLEYKLNRREYELFLKECLEMQ